MAIFQVVSVNESELEAKIAELARELAPDVVQIRYNIGEDWTGAPSIFFRVLLSDKASKEPRLYEVTKRVTATIDNRLKSRQFGLYPYFNFRSKSEQAMLKEKSWA